MARLPKSFRAAEAAALQSPFAAEMSDPRSALPQRNAGSVPRYAWTPPRTLSAPDDQHHAETSPRYVNRNFWRDPEHEPEYSTPGPQREAGSPLDPVNMAAHIFNTFGSQQSQRDYIDQLRRPETQTEYAFGRQTDRDNFAMSMLPMLLGNTPRGPGVMAREAEASPLMAPEPLLQSPVRGYTFEDHVPNAQRQRVIDFQIKQRNRLGLDHSAPQDIVDRLYSARFGTPIERAQRYAQTPEARTTDRANNAADQYAPLPGASAANDPLEIPDAPLSADIVPFRTYTPQPPSVGDAGGGRLPPADSHPSPVGAGLLSREQNSIYNDLNYHDQHTVEDVPIADIVRVHDIDPANKSGAWYQAQRAAGNSPREPSVARVNGRLVLMDGHHRLASEPGPTARVRVHDIDRLTNPPAGMEAVQNEATGEWTLRRAAAFPAEGASELTPPSMNPTDYQWDAPAQSQQLDIPDLPRTLPRDVQFRQSRQPLAQRRLQRAPPITRGEALSQAFDRPWWSNEPEEPFFQNGISSLRDRYGITSREDPTKLMLYGAGAAGALGGTLATAGAFDRANDAANAWEDSLHTANQFDREDIMRGLRSGGDPRERAPVLPPSPGPQDNFSPAELRAARAEIEDIFRANGALGRADITDADVRRQAQIRREGLRHGPGEPLDAPRMRRGR